MEAADNTPLPDTWRHVGEVSDLRCYPIKSFGSVKIKPEGIQCNALGMEDGSLRDRVFMVVTETDGKFVTGRKYPQLAAIRPKLMRRDILKLYPPQGAQLCINIKELESEDTMKTTNIWGEEVEVVDCGDVPAKWISLQILQESTGLRLVYYPKSSSSRDVVGKNLKWPAFSESDGGALHDTTTYMLINESSVDDLNSKLDIPVTPLRFRPNIIINGPAAFEEDSWNWIRIGENTIFRNVKPCKRCTFVNVDPETGVMDADEPLKTLKSYRLTPSCGQSPVMGIYMGLRIPGKIQEGDMVYVA